MLVAASYFSFHTYDISDEHMMPAAARDALLLMTVYSPAVAEMISAFGSRAFHFANTQSNAII